jgi:hypothetical protein
MKGRTIRRTECRSSWGWTPQEHVRTALHLLRELENELRSGGSIAAGALLSDPLGHGDTAAALARRGRARFTAFESEIVGWACPHRA